MKKLGLGIGLLCAALLVGCGAVGDEAPEDTNQGMGAVEAALNTYPDCCSAVPGSGVTESFCDSVAYSPGRCNAVSGGNSCTWNTTACPVTCCQPKSGSTVPWNYCNTYSISAARCNAVNSGTTCAWSC